VWNLLCPSRRRVWSLTAARAPREVRDVSAMDPSPAKLKQIIVLLSSFFACLFFGVLGYDVFKDGLPPPLLSSEKQLVKKTQPSAAANSSTTSWPPPGSRRSKRRGRGHGAVKESIKGAKSKGEWREHPGMMLSPPPPPPPLSWEVTTVTTVTTVAAKPVAAEGPGHQSGGTNAPRKSRHKKGAKAEKGIKAEKKAEKRRLLNKSDKQAPT